MYFIYLFIYFSLYWVIISVQGLSLFAVHGGAWCSPVVVCGLLIVVAALVVEHRL